MTITTMKHKTTHNTPIKYPYQHQETMDGSQKKNTLPFWLGHEDPDQLEKITQLYTNYLHLDNTNDNSPTKAARAARWNNKSSSSSSLNEDDLINYAQRPMDFIGKIVRYPLIDQRPFVTLDIVQIYKREAIVQGKSFPYSNTMYVETEWDLLDGLPIHFKTCSKKHVTSVASEQSNNPPYIIITSPIFTSDKSCTYRSVVGSDNIYSSVGYCDLFSQCLERSLERSPCSERDQEEDEEEEDDDLEYDDDEYGDDYFDEDSDEEEEPQTKSHDDYLQSLLCPKSSSSSICEFSSFTFYTSTTVTATSQEEVDCDEDDQAQWDEWEEEEELDSPPHIPHHYCNISIRI